MATGKPIVYTSSDSVFQIAAHEEVLPVEELYNICEVARELCDEYQVVRVIAIPFIGTSGQYVRTERRRDFSIPPVEETVLDRLSNRGVRTVGIGKIGDIFCERGIDSSYHDGGNAACLARILEVLREQPVHDRFVFVNLVDTDTTIGQRPYLTERRYCGREPVVLHYYGGSRLRSYIHRRRSYPGVCAAALVFGKQAAGKPWNTEAVL